jgi:hypothetical protein
MIRGRRLVVAGVALVAMGAGGVGIARAVGSDSDQRATGPDADRAGQAAVESVGGGRVVGIEREGEGNTAWEVEVAQAGGRRVEVALNTGLERVGLETDDDGGKAEREGDDGD